MYYIKKDMHYYVILCTYTSIYITHFESQLNLQSRYSNPNHLIRADHLLLPTIYDSTLEVWYLYCGSPFYK